MNKTQLDAEVLLRTTGAVRQYTDEPVTLDDVYDLLDIARFAPNGGNRQGWHVVVVDDTDREHLAKLCESAHDRYIAQRLAGEAPWNTIVATSVTQTGDRLVEGRPLLDVITAAPVLLAVGVDLRQVASFDAGLDRVGVVSGASIYPFAWSLLLAARARGLGGTFSTFAVAAEPEVKAILHAPDHVALACLVAIGYPARRPTRLTRRAVGEFATLGRFDGAALARSSTPPRPTPRQITA